MSSSVNCKNGDKNLQENGSDKFDDSRKLVKKVEISKNSSPLHSTSADSDSNSKPKPNANDALINSQSVKSSERNLLNGSSELQAYSNVQHVDAEERDVKASDKPGNLVDDSTLVGIFNNFTRSRKKATR